MQPTAAMSPGLKLFDVGLPPPVDPPDDLVTGHARVERWATRPTRCVPYAGSEWHTPQNRISISTSSGPASRRGMLAAASGDVGLLAANARAVNMNLPSINETNVGVQLSGRCAAFSTGQGLIP